MDLNDKIAVVTQTLQQALGGLQSKIEEDTRKVIQNIPNQTSLLCVAIYVHENSYHETLQSSHALFTRQQFDVFAFDSAMRFDRIEKIVKAMKAQVNLIVHFLFSVC